ncbi:MAG: SpoIID/LytB domain-containing protein [Clostridiales bacterium]|nr:SpoIID/LytB domain-containing protein [Clostridiales bacterium]
MKIPGRFLLLLIVLMLSVQGLSSCMTSTGTENESKQRTFVPVDEVPALPDDLKLDQDGIPTLSVYDTTIDEISDMDIETYVMGVVAGEMKNDWPLEALKAQAILARTFVLKFCDDKESKYDGADISTDVEEAQAYSYENINDRVRQAVRDTSGQVMSEDGDFPYAWFHAHSGGMTELPSVALDFKDDDPEYLKPVNSGDSPDAPESVQNWTAEFTKDEIVKAANDCGLDIKALESIKPGEKGASGRLATILINGQSVSGPTFRIKIGANKLKSTLITSIDVKDDKVIFKGKGFGHGVGMSQWGAYAMAEAGKSANQIVEYYFPSVDIVRLW